ncbi:MAG TPA: LssY C-terminal domain-containing protein [Acidobacteriaceae bacterium]|nr:LssY C-terminal domain-containing protein [Acidobacteriaceae bacterium]
MGRGDVRRAVRWLFLVPFLFPAFHGRAETIPVGATLEVRLEQPISSYSTHKGKHVSCLLIAPVSVDGKILLPMGVTLKGSVVAIRKVGLGFVHETAQIDLVLQTLVLANGTSVPLRSQLTQVENARESVDKEGRIQGIRSTATLSQRASGTVGMLALGDPIAAVFTVAASSSVLRFSEPEILLPTGTEMTAKLTAPIEIPSQHIVPTPTVTVTAAEAKQLRAVIRKQPFRTVTDGTPHVPSDLTNLMFIGSSGAIERAFAASGWEPVDELNAQTTYSTVRAIAENQGYRRAPMSILLLDGAPPKYAYAKTLNTFSKRHHLRIFSTDATWQGEPVWNSSSTHDIGIGFSKKNKTFIHLIDSNIDNERAKVIDDLLLTGCVTGVQMVSRPWVPRDAKNGTNEALITDGKIAVIQLNNCDQPKDDFADDQPVPLPVHGNSLDRSTRQTVLTLRNNILRENVVVTAYSGIHYLSQSKEKKEEAKAARVVNVSGQEYDVEKGFHANEAYAGSSYTSMPSGKRHRHAAWTPPSVELGVHSGWAGYAGGNGGEIGYLLNSIESPGSSEILLVLGNAMDNGWNIGGSVTLDSQKYFSHEFSYDHSFTTFVIGLALIDHETTTPSQDPLFAFSNTGLQTSQVTYDLLINGRPKTSRWRPYLAVGPAFQLMHLTDAPIKKAPGYFKLGLSSVGLITAAYDFGSTPPLEGGGIFQFGFNYGVGVRYRLTPRWMARVDYRETLISQPDFWSKSKDDILNNLYAPDYTIQEVGPVFDSAMREQHATAGISFTF